MNDTPPSVDKPRGRGPWRFGDADPGWVMRVVGEATGRVYVREGSEYGARWFDEQAPRVPLGWGTWQTMVGTESEVRPASAFFEPVPDDTEGRLRCAVCHDAWPLGESHACLPPFVPPFFRVGGKNIRNVYLVNDGCDWHAATVLRAGFGPVLVEALNAWLLTAQGRETCLPVCDAHHQCLLHEWKGERGRGVELWY